MPIMAHWEDQYGNTYTQPHMAADNRRSRVLARITSGWVPCVPDTLTMHRYSDTCAICDALRAATRQNVCEVS